MKEEAKETLIGFFLECAEPGTPKLQKFLELLVKYTEGVNKNVTGEARAGALASFLHRIDMSMIEGYAATVTPAYNEALTDLRDGYIKDSKPDSLHLEALLREEREKYTKLLDEYGDHAGVCDVSNTVCTCGWEKARAGGN